MEVLLAKVYDGVMILDTVISNMTMSVANDDPHANSH